MIDFIGDFLQFAVISGLALAATIFARADGQFYAYRWFGFDVDARWPALFCLSLTVGAACEVAF